MSSTCPHNMVNFGLLAAEIGWPVWGTSANFNWFSLLGSVTARHLVVGVSQTLRHWTEGATYIQQGDHHVGHWPTFLVPFVLAVWINHYFGTFLWFTFCRILVSRDMCMKTYKAKPVVHFWFSKVGDIFVCIVWWSFSNHEASCTVSEWRGILCVCAKQNMKHWANELRCAHFNSVYLLHN